MTIPTLLKTECSDEQLLDALQHAAFDYFVDTVNPANGLVPDTSRKGSPCSIAVVGFALSCYPIGVSRGWISRGDAVELTLTTLRFFAASSQGAEPDVTGYKGFYYHFLDMQTGLRVWQCELSLIDTTLLLAGILTAACFFTGDAEAEREIRQLADVLYCQVDWNWARDGEPTVSQGWHPQSGFIRYRWQGYSEAAILYVLGLASPTHPLNPDSFPAWSLTYQWERIYRNDCLYAGPLFIHLFSQAWIDFRGIRDAFCALRATDYFENTRHAIQIQRHYAKLNPGGFAGYSEDIWGLTACDGAEGVVTSADGIEHRLLGYSARGVPYGPDDGTLAPWAASVCVPFEPGIAIAGLRTLLATYPRVLQKNRFAGSFNPTLATSDDTPEGWISQGCYGLDQGLLVMMIENHRTGLIWQLMRNSPIIRTGLHKAGFKGGWLG